MSEKLLINEDKSNNFEVKSNNLPSVLTNEEKVSEEVKQIKEIAKILNKENGLAEDDYYFVPDATLLYDSGYRKQSEGHWIRHSNTFECSVCKKELFIEYAEDYDAIEDWELYFCPFCSANMKGGE